jgi:hypothetical protein
VKAKRETITAKDMVMNEAPSVSVELVPLLTTGEVKLTEVTSMARVAASVRAVTKRYMCLSSQCSPLALTPS